MHDSSHRNHSKTLYREDRKAVIENRVIDTPHIEILILEIQIQSLKFHIEPALVRNNNLSENSTFIY